MNPSEADKDFLARHRRDSRHEFHEMPERFRRDASQSKDHIIGNGLNHLDDQDGSHPTPRRRDRGHHDPSVHYLSQVKAKAEVLSNRVRRAPEKFSDAEREEIEKSIEDYLKLEDQVAGVMKLRHVDHEKIRAMKSPEERKEYLESLKGKQSDFQKNFAEARENARSNYLSIKTVIDNKLNAQAAELR